MATDKATYWLAVGLLALGVNSTFQNQEVQWAHDLADRTSLAAEVLAQRGLGYLAMAEVMLGSSPAQSPRLQAALARLQAKTAHAEGALASREASRAMVEAQRVNLEFRQRQLAYAAEDLNRCPYKAMVRVPRLHIPRVEFQSPDVEVPNVQVRVPEVHVPIVYPQVPEVRVPDVNANVQQVLDRVHDQLQNLSDLKSAERYRAFESLKNLPDASDIDFSDMSSTPQVRVVIHSSGANNGPI